MHTSFMKSKKLHADRHTLPLKLHQFSINSDLKYGCICVCASGQCTAISTNECVQRDTKTPKTMQCILSSFILTEKHSNYIKTLPAA